MSYELTDLNPLHRAWLFRNSNIPRRFIGLEPKDIVEKTGTFPEPINDWIDEVHSGQVIKNIGGLGTTGVGLLFDGAPGLGKTTHAVTAAMELIRRLPKDDTEVARILGYNADDFGRNSFGMRPVYYMTFPEFLSRKKALIEADSDVRSNLYLEMEGFHGRAKEDWLNVRVLILDDLGKEYGSKYDDTSFDEVLRARYDKALPTIITTNVRRENWAKQYGEAMGSFAFEAFHRIAILGKDLRKE
jgi:DNA replication protein DnaC